MDQGLKPVATDETLKKIVEELYKSNLRYGAIKEILQAICDKMDSSAGESGENGSESVPELFFIPVSYSGSAYTVDSSVAFSDVEAAYFAEKLLIFRIEDAANAAVYFNPVSSRTKVGSYIIYRATTGSSSNPSGANGLLQYMSSGAFSFNPQYVRTRADYVECSVAIGGTQYTTLDAALTALAALYNT